MIVQLAGASGEADTDVLGEGVGQLVALGEGVGESLLDSVGDGVRDGLDEGLDEPDRLGDGLVKVGDDEGVAVTEGVGDCVGVGEGLRIV